MAAAPQELVSVTRGTKVEADLTGAKDDPPKRNSIKASGAESEGLKQGEVVNTLADD